MRKKTKKRVFLRRKQKKLAFKISAVIFIAAAIMASNLYWEADVNSIYSSINNSYYDTFSVKNIEISGCNKLNEKEILSITNLKKGDPISRVDVSSIKDLLDNYSWIKDSSVSKKYPDTIKINIQEEVPQAIWWNKGKFYLVSQDGVVIQNVKEPEVLNPYILLFGTNAPSCYTKLYQSLFNASIFLRSVALSFIGGRRWDLYLDDGIMVKLPEKHAENALIILDNFYKKGIIKSKEVLEIDMRLYPDKIFVKKR